MGVGDYISGGPFRAVQADRLAPAAEKPDLCTRLAKLTEMTLGNPLAQFNPFVIRKGIVLGGLHRLQAEFLLFLHRFHGVVS